MPILLHTQNESLHQEDAERLWHGVLTYTHSSEANVAVRFVDEAESRRLNHEYRQKDAPTNVLTFSYESEQEGREHDIALCLPVAVLEAKERGVLLRDYVALLLVHALLHATGMDHERSPEEATATRTAEHNILKQAGFNAIMLE